MKEQVSVSDINLIIGYMLDSGNNRCARMLTEFLSEYERLKRLHANLQSQIKDLETWLAEEESQVTRYEIEETIQLLKGLYDEH